MFHKDIKNPPLELKSVQYLFKIQEKLVPELITLAEIRYTILKNVYYNQPVGRRTLARRLDISERTARNELDFLQVQGLLNVTQSGARISTTGEDFLEELDKYIKEIKDIKNLEKRLTEILGLEQVHVVPGQLEFATVKEELGRYTARLLKELLQEGQILAVTGGSTLAQVARVMQPEEEGREVMVVPGRGGLGEQVEIQANTIAAKIGKKMGGSYKLLHIPDSLDQQNLSWIISEPSIRETLSYLKRADILLHGVGNAREMAVRRGIVPDQIESIISRGAIGEAFGFYFGEEGQIVHTTSCVGLDLDALKQVEKVVAVAGGKNKARAIVAVVSPEYQDILVTDEATAREIISLKLAD
ncbi:MAG: sugar-binding transcriptional regulator [Bacillota bacterium]